LAEVTDRIDAAAGGGVGAAILGQVIPIEAQAWITSTIPGLTCETDRKVDLIPVDDSGLHEISTIAAIIDRTAQ